MEWRHYITGRKDGERVCVMGGKRRKTLQSEKKGMIYTGCARRINFSLKYDGKGKRETRNRGKGKRGRW